MTTATISIKQQANRFVKVLGIMAVVAVVAAFAAMAFPGGAFASSAPRVTASASTVYGKGQVTVINAVTGHPISGAVVEFQDGMGKSVATAVTAENGQVGVALPQALYQLKVVAQGFQPANSAIKIAYKTLSTQEVVLLPDVQPDPAWDPTPTPTPIPTPVNH
jgi:hypothetical protein